MKFGMAYFHQLNMNRLQAELLNKIPRAIDLGLRSWWDESLRLP